VSGNLVSLFCIVSTALVSSPCWRPLAKTNPSAALCSRIKCSCLCHCQVAAMSELSTAALLQFLTALGFLNFHKHTGLVNIWGFWSGRFSLMEPMNNFTAFWGLSSSRETKSSSIVYWPDLWSLLISQKCGLVQ